ncbi:ARMT1-like domain-containing protein [bacterium]|nr:ARMT1-like domain-containing protein [bacterium]
MKTHPECIPCFIRQTLDAARLVSDDPALHERALLEACAVVSGMDTSEPPPAMAGRIQKIIRRLSGVADPYNGAKSRFNGFILARVPHLESLIRGASDPFETALRLAIAGNIIDFGIHIGLSEADVEAAIEHSLSVELDRDSVHSLRRALAGARRLLYVGDNAGEVVFDRLFLEQIKALNPGLTVTFATRGAPILNDITREDALQAGVDRFARVIDNGDDSAGCVLSLCGAEFLEELGRADLLISKGQGNFETLNETTLEAFFLLKAKCPVIARVAGARQGDLLVLHRPAAPDESR